MKLSPLLLTGSALLLGAAVATSGIAAPAAAPAGDPVKGKTVYARCAICHDFNPGVKKLGPHLSGLFGRKAGSVASFNYSPALKGSKIVWNAKTLDSYIASPAKFVPGNKMAFGGIANPADRANLIAYLQSAGK